MATNTMDKAALLVDKHAQSWPRIERKIQKQLRNSGQEYLSRTGRIIPAKKQPAILCQCPQRCGTKVPPDARRLLFSEFYALADHTRQNEVLIRLIATRRLIVGFPSTGNCPRRITCRYSLPLLTDACNQLLPAVTDSSKSVPRVEVCQKAFMNVFAITEKRVRLQRERLVARSRLGHSAAAAAAAAAASRVPLFSTPHLRLPSTQISLRESTTPSSVSVVHTPPMQQPSSAATTFWHPDELRFLLPSLYATTNHADWDLVESFFSNQLWKLEYIT